MARGREQQTMTQILSVRMKDLRELLDNDETVGRRTG